MVAEDVATKADGVGNIVMAGSQWDPASYRLSGLDDG